VWGQNIYGQLGLGDLQHRAEPTLLAVPDGIPFTAVACGWDHCIALNEKKQCYVWGVNHNAECGLGKDTPSSVLSPLLLSAPDAVPFITVSCGRYHSAACNERGQHYIWGHNGKGQLGLGTDGHGRTPTLIESHNFTKVFTMGFQSAGITSDGSCFVWGCNQDGELGLEHRTVSQDEVLIPTLLPCVSSDPFKQITGGNGFSIGFTTAGTVYAWGQLAVEQLGCGDTDDHFAPIQLKEGYSWVFCGSSFCIGMKHNGTCSLWGYVNDVVSEFPTPLALPTGVPLQPSFAVPHAFNFLMDNTFFHNDC
jgi:alpha-tubulin suppressor-like RCC1 family protein